ncbi:MAG: Pr6Pr family membrane protein [Nocardioidaceae bacterium]
MLTRRPDRLWHLLTAVVAGFAVVFQLWLVVDGAATLLPESQPALVTRLVRFVSYFTILSNILVCVVAAGLVRGVPDTRLWRVLRLDAVLAIAVTGVVHWFLLRPLLDLHGASYLADKLLHLVVPLLAVVGWLALGPRRQFGRADVLPALVFPVGWLAWTLVHGALSGWYPYPFVDVEVHGYVAVALNCLGVAVLFVVLAAGAVWLDPRLGRRRS